MSVLEKKDKNIRAKRKKWGNQRKSGARKRRKARKRRRKARRRKKARKKNKAKKKSEFKFFSQIVVGLLDCLLNNFLFIYFLLYA